jgi:hypothetical protein
MAMEIEAQLSKLRDEIFLDAIEQACTTSGPWAA